MNEEKSDAVGEIVGNEIILFGGSKKPNVTIFDFKSKIFKEIDVN